MKKILYCMRHALPGAWESANWLLKLMIPISLAVTLLQHFGILDLAARFLHPFFVHLGLPGSSAITFISGAAAGTYAGIAAMMSMPLTMKQATILSLMIALCHALPMECAVNKKTGSSFWKMALIRVIMAFACAAILNLLLAPDTTPYLYIGAETGSTLAQVMQTWVVSQIQMSLTVALIIYILMVIQRMIEAYKLLTPLSHFFAPLMCIFGLPRQAAYMWLVGNILGISYGSAVMVELEDKGLISRNDANDVNYHLIMNHSMLEDTIVFASTGIPAILIISTRISFALALVWLRKATRTLIHNNHLNYAHTHTTCRPL